MKIHIVIASVNDLLNIAGFKEQLIKNANKIKIIVVDEGDEKIRGKNRQILQGLQYEFYGPNERRSWFSARFGSNYEKYLTVIPERCHAETSFGFLIAYEEGADVIIEVDDDVYPVNGYNLLQDHISNLFSSDGVTTISKNKWYNTLENLMFKESGTLIFPRGHPYSPQTRLMNYIWTNNGGMCVLNMGLWSGHPDLDALTILYHDGLNGRCNIKSVSLKRRKVIIGRGTYFAICSMNTAFRRDIIPAFYQLYMKYFGIDRFDDIWSGIFLKKIADHLNDKVCIGAPLVYHDKKPRSVFKDLKAELEGIIINESLWEIIDKIELSEKDYYGCYSELADGIKKNLGKINEKLHKDFLDLQAEKMKIWLKVIDKIK
jgi:hypothetical protein